MRTIETYRVFGLCVALASGALALACSDNNPGAGGGGKTGAGGGATTGSPTTTSSTTTSTTTGAGGGGGGGTGKAVTYCTMPYAAPVPITTANCTDFESDDAGTNPLGIHCIMPGGIWAIDTDKTGTPPDKSPPVVAACGTNGMGVHFAGAGHTGWGADIAAAVVSQAQPVDVSGYSGISFVMKSVAPNTLIFKVQNPYSQPGCGLCTEGDPINDCYSGYAKNPVALPAGSTTPIVVTWADLTQQGYGFRAPGTTTFDPGNLVSIAFAFNTGVDFDVCIDDIKFVP
jgi:hypothetical protein